MKKTVLALVTLVCLTTAVNAQKGSTLLYGNVGFTTLSNGSNSHPGTFNINPGVGYQLNDAWTVGVEGKYNYVDDASSIDRTYAAGAFLRYSQHLAGIFSVYEQLGLGWQGESTTASSVDTKSSGFYASVTPTIYADIKNGFGLNFSIGGLAYSSMKVSGASNSTSVLGLTFGQGASFGISKNFGGSKKK